MNLYAGTYNGQVYMLQGHPSNLSLKRRNQISQTSIRALVLPQNSIEVLCAGFEGQITSIHKSTLVSMKQTKQPKGIINCMACVNDKVVAVGHQNGLIRFWDWRNWSLRKQLREHKKPVRNFCIDNNSVVFMSAAAKGIVLWDTQKYDKVFNYKFDYEIQHVLIDIDMKFILLINPKQIHQILASSNQQVALYKMQGSETIQSAIIFLNYVIIGGDKGSIFIWGLGQYQHKISFQAHKMRVKCIKIVHYDEIDYLITASSNGEISVWDVLEFLKEVDKISQDYNLEGLQPLWTMNLDRRIICIQTGLIQQQPQTITSTSNVVKAAQQSQHEEVQISKKKKKQIKKEAARLANHQKSYQVQQVQQKPLKKHLPAQTVPKFSAQQVKKKKLLKQKKQQKLLKKIKQNQLKSK